jgi:hypothetical protein
MFSLVFPSISSPLLASYPRSGTNWIRYFIEQVTNRPTPGQFRCVSGTDYVIDRAHKAYPVLHKYRRVILVVRDYKECFLRNNKTHWLATNDVDLFLEDSTTPQPCFWYIKNIEAFDRYRHPKILVYFEDLMRRPETELLKIGSFLDFPRESVIQFLDGLEDHFKASLNLYNTGNSSQKLTYNMNLKAHCEALLCKEQVQEFDDYFLNKYPVLSKTYLLPYHYKFTNNG